MTKASEKPSRRKRFRWLTLFLVAAGAWVAYMLLGTHRTSLLLPGDVRVEYHGSTTGHHIPGHTSGGHYLYLHPPPPEDSHVVQEYWEKFRDWLPGPISSHLPEWKHYRMYFPSQEHLHLRELRLRVHGAYPPYNWRIFIADDNGWETEAVAPIWADDNFFDQGAGEYSSWIRLTSPIPLHSKTLRLRFRPTLPPASVDGDQKSPPPLPEMKIHNPFLVDADAAPAPGEPLPITRTFAGTEFILEKLTRDTVVGAHENSGKLAIEFRLRKDGALLEDYFVQSMAITDSSGQFFHATRNTHVVKNGLYRVSLDTAPWSDDPCWIIRFELHRVRIHPETNAREILLDQKIEAEFKVHPRIGNTRDPSYGSTD